MSRFKAPKLFSCENPLFTVDKNNFKEVKTLFEKAVLEFKLLNKEPGNETQIKLYSLYKQATEGDIKGEPPKGSLDPIEKAKYDAWATLKGKSITDAQTEYICLVNCLKD